MQTLCLAMCSASLPVPWIIAEVERTLDDIDSAGMNTVTACAAREHGRSGLGAQLGCSAGHAF